jgi:glycosyltransferase involved in cell wall biosynthesis
MSKLSVLIPVLNEEESVRELYSRLVAVLKKNRYDYEIIFVDDGSSDATADRVKALQKDRNVKLVSFQMNYGKSAGLSTGFEMATGDYLVTMDGDLQDDPAEIPNLVAKLEEGYDLVSGWKFKRRDPIGKTVPSFFWNLMIRSVSKVRIHDFNCGLKIYRRKVYKNLEIYGSLYRYIPALAGNMGFRVTEIKVNHLPRKFGKSKYGVGGRFLGGLLDFFTVVFLSRYLNKPLHFFGTWGLFFILGGLAMDGYVLYLKLLTGTIQNKLPFFLGGILLLLVGIQFVSIGLLGELITKTSAKKRKYIVK